MKRKISIFSFIIIFFSMVIMSMVSQGKTSQTFASEQNLPTPTPTLVYRWPWPKDTTDRELSPGYTELWHLDPKDGIDFLVKWDQNDPEPDLSVISLANGKITEICQNSTYGVAFIEIEHDSNEGQEQSKLFNYVHLKHDSIPDWIVDTYTQQGYVEIVQGQLLGTSKPGNIIMPTSSPCYQKAYQGTTSAHLHLDIPSTPISLNIDGWQSTSPSNCFSKEGESDDYCHKEPVPSDTISINCNANQPYIGSKLCRRSFSLLRPGFDQGIPRDRINFFENPFDVQGPNTELGSIPKDSLLLTVGEAPVRTENGNVNWQVFILPNVHGNSTADFTHIRWNAGENRIPTQPVWVHEPDVEEVNRPFFPDTQYASDFFIYEEMVNQYNLFNGKSDGSFDPDAPLQRKHVALVFYRMMNNGRGHLSEMPMSDEENNPSCDSAGLLEALKVASCDEIQWTFGDVNDPSDPSHLAVEWLSRQKTRSGSPVVKGTSDDCNGKPCFKPGNHIIRAEFTTIAIKVFQTLDIYEHVAIGQCPYEFSDVDDDSPHAPYIEVACALRVLEGFDRNGQRVFGHEDVLTRDQAAKMMARLYLINEDVNFFEPAINANTVSLSFISNNNNTLNNFVAPQALLDLRWALLSQNSCQVYGVHSYDNGNQVSILNFNGIENVFTDFGPLQTDIPITAIEMHPITHKIYGVSSPEGQPSQLYLIDPYFGSLSLIGTVREASGKPFFNIGGLEFGNDGILYAYINADKVEDNGIISLNPQNGVADSFIHFNHKMYALTQNLETGHFWIATQRFIYVIDGNGEVQSSFLNETTGQISAMDFINKDHLLFSIRKADESIIYELNTVTNELKTIHWMQDDANNVTSLAWPSWCDEDNALFNRLSRGYETYMPIITVND